MHAPRFAFGTVHVRVTREAGWLHKWCWTDYCVFQLQCSLDILSSSLKQFNPNNQICDTSINVECSGARLQCHACSSCRSVLRDVQLTRSQWYRICWVTARYEACLTSRPQGQGVAGRFDHSRWPLASAMPKPHSSSTYRLGATMYSTEYRGARAASILFPRHGFSHFRCELQLVPLEVLWCQRLGSAAGGC